MCYPVVLLCDYGDDLRRWDGKPTLILEGCCLQPGAGKGKSDSLDCVGLVAWHIRTTGL